MLNDLPCPFFANPSRFQFSFQNAEIINIFFLRCHLFISPSIYCSRLKTENNKKQHETGPSHFFFLWKATKSTAGKESRSNISQLKSIKLNISLLHKIHRSTDFEALNLWMGLSEDCVLTDCWTNWMSHVGRLTKKTRWLPKKAIKGAYVPTKCCFSHASGKFLLYFFQIFSRANSFYFMEQENSTLPWTNCNFWKGRRKIQND